MLRYSNTNKYEGDIFRARARVSFISARNYDQLGNKGIFLLILLRAGSYFIFHRGEFNSASWFPPLRNQIISNAPKGPQSWKYSTRK